MQPGGRRAQTRVPYYETIPARRGREPHHGKSGPSSTAGAKRAMDRLDGKPDPVPGPDDIWCSGVKPPAQSAGEDLPRRATVCTGRPPTGHGPRNEFAVTVVGTRRSRNHPSNGDWSGRGPGLPGAPGVRCYGGCFGGRWRGTGPSGRPVWPAGCAASQETSSAGVGA